MTPTSNFLEAHTDPFAQRLRACEEQCVELSQKLKSKFQLAGANKPTPYTPYPVFGHLVSTTATADIPGVIRDS